jgi:uncharacterized protein YpiB (UPF0302 family)
MHDNDDYFWQLFNKSLPQHYWINPYSETTIKVREMGRLGVVDFSTEIEQLEKQIDKALEDGSKEEFMRLSKRYKYLKAEGC